MNTKEIMKLADAYAAERQWASGYSDACMEAREALEAALTEQQATIDFYQLRVELLQKWQSKMRDPERTIACDIIANGQTIEDVDPQRYALTEKQEPVNQQLLEALKMWVALVNADANNEFTTVVDGCCTQSIGQYATYFERLTATKEATSAAIAQAEKEMK